MHLFSQLIMNTAFTYIFAKNYKGKPLNYDDKKKAVGGLLIMSLIAFMLFIAAVISVFRGSAVLTIVMLAGIYGCVYMISLSPWVQNAENYRFEGDTPEDLRVFYKGKEVLVDYIVNEDGTIDFEDNTKKHKYIRWADGSRMREKTAYMILNYFMMYMAGYLSEDARAARFEI